MSHEVPNFVNKIPGLVIFDTFFVDMTMVSLSLIVAINIKMEQTVFVLNTNIFTDNKGNNHIYISRILIMMVFKELSIRGKYKRNNQKNNYTTHQMY
jgi:hypothetical protein